MLLDFFERLNLTIFAVSHKSFGSLCRSCFCQTQIIPPPGPQLGSPVSIQEGSLSCKRGPAQSDITRVFEPCSVSKCIQPTWNFKGYLDANYVQEAPTLDFKMRLHFFSFLNNFYFSLKNTPYFVNLEEFPILTSPSIWLQKGVNVKEGNLVNWAKKTT